MRTAHTLHLDFKVCAAVGRVCGAATHAVGEDIGYGLLAIFCILSDILKYFVSVCFDISTYQNKN